MKKMFLLVTSCVLAILVLSGCKKPINATEAMTTYIDTVVYRKKQKEN